MLLTVGPGAQAVTVLSRVQDEGCYTSTLEVMVARSVILFWSLLQVHMPSRMKKWLAHVSCRLWAHRRTRLSTIVRIPGVRLICSGVRITEKPHMPSLDFESASTSSIASLFSPRWVRTPARPRRAAKLLVACNTDGDEAAGVAAAIRIRKFLT